MLLINRSQMKGVEVDGVASSAMPEDVYAQVKCVT